MAYGKSLELAKIGPIKPEVVCICGLVWSKHLKKDGSILKKFETDFYKKHRPAGRMRGDTYTKKK